MPSQEKWNLFKLTPEETENRLITTNDTIKTINKLPLKIYHTQLALEVNQVNCLQNCYLHIYTYSNSVKRKKLPQSFFKMMAHH